MTESASRAPEKATRTSVDDLNRQARRRRVLDISLAVVTVGVLVAAVIAAAGIITMRLEARSTTLSARAVANLTQVVRDSPDDARARILLGDALAADGRDRQAQEQYQAALVISEDDPGALAGLAQLAMSREEWRTAEEYWRKIVDILKAGQYATQDLRLEKAYFYLGTTLMEVKEYEEAANAFKEALRLKRDASDSHYLLATAYREMDLEDKYRQELEIALKYDPLMPEANYEFGKLLLSKGDEAGAAERFRLSADNAPPGRTEPFDELAKFGTAEDRYAKAVAAQKAGEFEDALTQARIAVAIDPYDIEAIRLTAQLLEKQKEVESARAAWDRLLSLEPTDEEATAAAARLAEKKQ